VGDVEGTVRELRAVIRAPGMSSPVQTAWRLAAHLNEWLEVEVDEECSVPFVQRSSDGRAFISIPGKDGEFQQALHLLEEIGHWKFPARPASTLAPVNGDRSQRRLFLIQDDRGETLARRFVLAWLFPLDAFDLTIPAEQLAAEAECPVELARERLEMLAG
jgi:hypothetical protein